METAPPTNSRADWIPIAVCVSVLLVGTATGSAWVLLALAAVALAVLLVAYRRRLNRSALLATAAAAVVAFVAAVALTRF